jgi:protein-ribulosamine 3-kinase
MHGDLWDGNCSTAVGTDGPVIYDASVLSAHNEYEFILRCTRGGLTRQMNLHYGDAIDTGSGSRYMRAYYRYFPISAPEKDYDDRNLLYCM